MPSATGPFFSSRSHFWSSFWQLVGASGGHFNDFKGYGREAENILKFDEFWGALGEASSVCDPPSTSHPRALPYFSETR